MKHSTMQRKFQPTANIQAGLNAHKIHTQAYHSCSFTGNHCITAIYTSKKKWSMIKQPVRCRQNSRRQLIDMLGWMHIKYACRLTIAVLSVEITAINTSKKMWSMITRQHGATEIPSDNDIQTLADDAKDQFFTIKTLHSRGLFAT